MRNNMIETEAEVRYSPMEIAEQLIGQAEASQNHATRKGDGNEAAYQLGFANGIKVLLESEGAKWKMRKHERMRISRNRGVTIEEILQEINETNWQDVIDVLRTRKKIVAINNRKAS
jgi:hypothetical protein